MTVNASSDDSLDNLGYEVKVGDGPIVGEIIRRERWLFQQWVYNGVFEGRWKDAFR
jgi:hypothetical protein